MKLIQVRKGQFVYYNNELHKVYGVKPMYKKSVHLIRMRDLAQVLTNAASVERYKPKELDSLIFNHKAFTLRKDRNAEEGDYILINNPKPDALDTYTLNEIELVETVENKGVVTSNSHGVKHNEYIVMAPGRDPDGTPIDFKDIDKAEAAYLQDTESEHLTNLSSGLLPSIGDIYKKTDSAELFEAMVVAVKDQTVYLGGNMEVTPAELMDKDKWEFLYNIQDQDT